MNLSSAAQAILLLTCYFGKASNESVKPLSNGEWGRFALWLKDTRRLIGSKPTAFVSWLE